jgi:hypothetical protein
LTLRGKINSVMHHPSILKDVIHVRVLKIYENKIRTLDEVRDCKGVGKDIPKFISRLKETSPYHINPNDKPKLNRLCYVEDWENDEIKETISSLRQHFPEIIARRDWEWALAVIAMRRFSKLNTNSRAIGIASANEVLIFYLANNVKHVYATDLYDTGKFNYTPLIFLKTQKSMHLFHTRKMI